MQIRFIQFWWPFSKRIEVCRLVGKARLFTRCLVIICQATWKIAHDFNVVFYDSIDLIDYLMKHVSRPLSQFLQPTSKYVGATRTYEPCRLNH